MYFSLNITGNSYFRKLSSLVFLYLISLGVFAQLTSTTTQTISTTQNYTGASNIGTGTVTISAGTTVTFAGSLTIGTGGSLIIQNGAKVIINGIVTIGTSQTGNVTVNNGGLLTVNPGASTGTAAIAMNSTSTVGLDIQTGGTVIVNAANAGNGILGMKQTVASKTNVAGALQIRGGGFNMDGTSSLNYSGSGNDTIIGPSNAGAYFTNNTVLTVGANVNLFISGDTKTDSNGNFSIEGNVSINGSYQGQNSTSNITGDGNINTTGSLNAGGTGTTVFGDNYTCTTGPCDGRKPCGRTATSSPATTTFCSTPTPTTLTASITGTGLVTYQWQSTTSILGTYTNISGATTATYSANPSSTTYYRAAIKNSSNCTTYTSKSTINIGTPKAGSITVSATACIGLSQTYSITALTGVTNYTWSVPSGSSITSGTGTNSIIVLMGSTSGNISVSATNSCGTGAASTLAVTPKALPAAAGTITGATTSCQGTSGTYSISSVSGATSYTWTLPSGTNIGSGSNNTTSITPSIGPNSGNIIVAGTNVCGNGPSSSLALTVSASRPAGPGAVSGPTTVCANSIQTYSVAAASDATSYSWTLPSGATVISGGTTNAITIKLGTSGGNLVVTPINICGSGYSSTYQWLNVNAATATSPSVTASSSATTICSGSSITLSAVSKNGGATPGYQWKKNNVNIIGATNATYVTTGAANNDSYTVVLTNNALCPNTATSNTVVIVVKTSVAPSVSAASTATIICPGVSITLTATPTNGGTTPTYQWKKNTVNISGATSSTYVTSAAANNDSYIVTMTSNVACPTIATVSSTAVVITIDSTCPNTWTGTTSTLWNVGSNWSTGNIPTSTNDVTIPATVSSGNMPTISTSVNAKSVSNAGTIKMDSTGTLNSYGNITNPGIFTTVSGSTVFFKGSTTQTMTGVPSLHNVVINNAAGVSIGSATIVKGTLSLTKGVLTTNSNLTINFDNGGNIGYSSSDAGSISGIVSGRRDVSKKTHYVCSPFNGVTTSQVALTTPLWVSPYWKMYCRDFSTQNYSAVINTTTAMPIGQGFTLAFVSPAPFILSGTYDHTFALTTPSYSNAVIDKYFMFGNPYPATIDWESSGISKNNIQGAIYYWDAINNRTGSYVSGLGTNGGTQYIPAMQAVLVSTKGTGGFSSVGINNTARLSLVNPTYLRVASEDIIRIKLESGDPSQNDETVIRFNDMATTNFDADLDANKIMNTGTIPNIYTMSGLNKYSINSYPTPDSVKVIPVFTKLPSDGSYTLKITNTNPSIQYVLVDKLLGIQQSITEAYSYSGLKADNAGRFELQLRETTSQITTGVQSYTNTSAVNILSSPNGFVVKSNVSGTGTIDILDVTGNLVKTLSNVSLTNGNNFFSSEIADGLYLIRVNIDNSTYVGQVSLIK